MALPFRVKSLDAVPEAVRGEYTEDNGEFVLAVDGLEDTGALKRALDHERTARKDADKRAKMLADEKSAAELEVLKKSGDVEALNASWQKKLDDATKAEKERTAAYERRVKQAAIDAAAVKLAGEISTVPALMKRALADRLYVDLVDDVPIVRVYGPDGKPSAANLDDLRKEVLAMPEYAAILIGSKASGGGAGSNANASGGNTGGAGSKKLSEMSEAERVALYRSDKDAFIRLRDADRPAA